MTWIVHQKLFHSSMLRFFDCLVFALDWIPRDSKDYLIGHRIRNALCTILNNDIVSFVVATRSQSPTKVYMITYGNNTYYNFRPNTWSGHCNYECYECMENPVFFCKSQGSSTFNLYIYLQSLSYFCVPWEIHTFATKNYRDGQTLVNVNGNCYKNRGNDDTLTHDYIFITKG